ncbi:MAG: nuclear transport factor 2 family protein [Rhodococcus sp. (in: high G+C Gram-positive bacteria)]
MAALLRVGSFACTANYWFESIRHTASMGVTADRCTSRAPIGTPVAGPRPLRSSGTPGTHVDEETPIAAASQSTVDLLREYFAAMESKDFHRLASFYANDVSLTFANSPQVVGKQVVLDQMVTIAGKVASLSHPLINVWQEDDGIVVFEVDSVWTFPDGVEATIRACSIFTIEDGLFTEQRIYVDNSPIDQYLR